MNSSTAVFRSSPPSPQVQSAGECKERGWRRRAQLWTFQESYIHFLDDDSLLYIFKLCQPILLDEASVRISQGGDWDRERWWYKLARVCRRWRTLILDSTAYLGLNLLCTYGTPVADMLAHSPHRPLILDYKDHDITPEEEKGLMLALRHDDRVRCIRLGLLPIPKLQKIIMAMDKEFTDLEFLHIAPPHKHAAGLKLPDTFKAPHLRHLTLMGFLFPIVPPFLATVVGLATLSLQDLHPSAYFCPEDLLQLLSSLPQLETFTITFQSPIPSRDVGMQLSHRRITTKVTLPNLRWLWYGGVSTYLEAILPRMTIPRLEWLQITLFHQLHFFMPNVLKLAENLTGGFGSAEFQFLDDCLRVLVYPDEGAEIYTFGIQISSVHLDWQVASAIQIFPRMRKALSAVEHLKLEFRRSYTSLEANNEADRTEWREFLGTFNNVKTLYVNDDYLGQISRALQVDDGILPLGLFPKLRKLEYYAKGGNPFATFADARMYAALPVTLVNHSTIPFPYRPLIS